MKFSLWNFKEWYVAHGIDLSYVITDSTASISILSFSAESANEQPGCALVRMGEEMTDCSGFHTVLQYGNDRLLFPIASPIEVWNCGNQMLRTLNDWESDLLNTIIQNDTITSVFKTAQTQFPFPFSLVSLAGNIISQSEDCKPFLSADSLHTVLQAALKSALDQPVCRSFPFDNMPTLLFQTIELNSSPTAVLIAYEGTERLRPGHLPLFHVIAEAFRCFLRFHAHTTLTSHPCAAWFRQLLSLTETEPLPTPPQMDSIHWNADDYYQIAVVQCRPDTMSSVLDDLSARLTSGGHCCIATDDGLSVLIHRGTAFPKEPLTLPLHTDNSSVYIGLSLPFRGILSLRPYIRQALLASHRAAVSESSCFDTEKQLSSCILQVTQSIDKGASLLHPDILKLTEADPDGADSLLVSLYTYYICGGSFTRAADRLFIHRNTLRQRLDRIRTITAQDIDAPQIKQQYLLSLLLLPHAC